MQVKIFSIPTIGGDVLNDEMNRFLRSKKVLPSGHWPEAKCQRHARSLLAFSQHADTNILRKNLLLRLQTPSQ